MSQMPHARQEKLIVRELEDEVLVYDVDRDKAYCLNDSVALVWKHCDGKTTTAAMARMLKGDSNATVDEDIVWLALRELERSHLLQGAVPKPLVKPLVTRRDLILKYAPAALSLPIIFAISVPTAAQSASCLPAGATCTLGSECCSKICDGVCIGTQQRASDE